MAAQDVPIEEQRTATAPSPGATAKVALVADRAAASGRGLLLLPFAASDQEGAVGRQISLLLQRRLQGIPDLEIGHGFLVAPAPEGRRHVPLARPLSPEQARACGAGWHATSVLYGAIALHPALRWTLILRDVASGEVLLEDTVHGDPEDVLEAPAGVAHAVARALGYDLDDPRFSSSDGAGTENYEALLAYLQALDARPQHGIAVPGLQSMREWLLRAAVLDPAFVAPAQLMLGDLLGAGDRAQVAVALVEAARPWGQDGATALTRIAAAAEERDHNREAEILMDAVLAGLPPSPQALELGARQAFRARRYAPARALLDTLLDMQPEHLAARELLADVLAAEGRFAGAAQQWELLVERRAPTPKVLMRLGSYLAVIGEFRRARSLLRQAAAQESVTLDALYHLGVVSYRVGAYGEGIAALRRAIERDPAAARAHALLARCYRRVDRDDLAHVHDAQAVALAPALWPSALALGYRALQDTRMDAALIAFAQVVNARPDLADGWRGLGLALLGNGMIDEARNALHQSDALQPGDATTLCALALAYSRAGDTLDAIQALRRAEELAPRNKMVAQCRLALRQETLPL